MAHIRVQIRKLWQTKQYESEECTLAYEEDVPLAEIENRMAKKALRREDAVAELAASTYISLEGAAARAMERSLARPDPRVPKVEVALPNPTTAETAALQKQHGVRPAPDALKVPLARPPMRRT